MGSLGNTASNTDAASADSENCFRKVLRQRWMGSEDCFAKHRVLGRYYVAVMLFSAGTIYIWSYVNIVFNTLDSFDDENNPLYPALKNSTAERNVIYDGYIGMEICAQIPGALLIYTISSHKFLTLAVAISSIIHMLTPFAVDPNSLLVAILVQTLMLAPLRIAVLSMWKDWASPNERIKFVILSLSFWILFIPSAFVLRSFYASYSTKESFYIAGVCGLVWSLLWFFTVTDTPANDSQVLENKQICLQKNTLPISKKVPKLSEVPWKGILTSVPVLSLCLLYFKTGSSFMLLESIDVGFFPPIETLHYKLVFLPIYTVVLIISALITDFLTRKYPGRINIRKGIICGALIIHAILLFGILIHNTTVIIGFSWLSNMVLCTSFTGIFTNALDLSSQYVSVIGGFIETSYLLGIFCGSSFIQNIDIDFRELDYKYSSAIFLFYEIGSTIVVTVIFYIWGSVEEQPWSLNSSSGLMNGNAQSYPVQEEHELRGTVPQNS